MATKILRVENCLPDYYNRRKNTTVNPRSCRLNADRGEKKNRGKKSKGSGGEFVENNPKKDVFVEQVKIIRRGQSLDEFFKPTDEKSAHKRSLIHKSSSDLVFWPEIYAGSAVSMSPSPSSVPFPSFGRKNCRSAVVDDFATRDLRRMLRLD